MRLHRGLPYEGEVAPERVAYWPACSRAWALQRVDVADTIGVGTPRSATRHRGGDAQALQHRRRVGPLPRHHGQALSNTLAALELGVWNFQSSVAGLGGCPYAKGATGNGDRGPGLCCTAWA